MRGNRNIAMRIGFIDINPILVTINAFRYIRFSEIQFLSKLQYFVSVPPFTMNAHNIWCIDLSFNLKRALAVTIPLNHQFLVQAIRTISSQLYYIYYCDIYDDNNSTMFGDLVSLFYFILFGYLQFCNLILYVLFLC